MKRTSLLIGLIISFCLLTISCKQDYETTSVLTEAETLMYTYPDSALQILEDIPQPEQLTGREQADYALLLTQARSRCRITATSDSLIRIATNYYQYSKDNSRKAEAFLYLGDVYMDMKKYSEAIVPLKQAEEIMAETSPYIQSLVYGKLGYLNRKSGNYKLAFRYYTKALNIDKACQNMEWVVSDLSNILNLPFPVVQDSTLFYIEQLKDILPEARPDLQAKAYNNIGVYYENIQEKELAITYYKKAIQTSVSVPYRAYLNLAQIYEKQGNIHLADSLYHKALQTPIWSTKAIICEVLYKRNVNNGNYPNAIKYLEHYQAATDSFYTHRQAKDIQELQAKYDHEVLACDKVETENLFYRIILGGIGLFLIVLTGCYWLYYQRKRNLKQIQECISEIELLTGEKNKAEDKIRELNQILSQGVALRDEVMQAKGEWTSIDDIRALGMYTRLHQNLQYYNPSSDYDTLLRWVNITSNHFAKRLIEKHSHLNTSEITLCCFTRMGYSNAQIAEILHVKQTSVNRYIYRTCEALKLPNSKESFLNYILSF